MDLNLFTTKSQEIISQAQQLTITNSHPAIENSHILSSIISIDKNVFPYIRSGFVFKRFLKPDPTEVHGSGSATLV